MTPTDDFSFAQVFLQYPNLPREPKRKSVLVDFSTRPRRRSRKVRFAKRLVTFEGKSPWSWEELQEGLKAIDEFEAFSNPRVLQERKYICRSEMEGLNQQCKDLYEYIRANPLGCPNTPYHRDTTVPVVQLKKEVRALRNQMQRLLQFAPRVFEQVHPFTSSNINYFTAIGPTKNAPQRGPIRKNPSLPAHVDTRSPLYVPATFMPLEAERYLLRFRSKMVAQWYQKTVSKSAQRPKIAAMTQHLEHSNFRSQLVDNPWQYWMYPPMMFGSHTTTDWPQCE